MLILAWLLHVGQGAPITRVFTGEVFAGCIGRGFSSSVNLQRSGGVNPVADAAERGRKSRDVIGPDVLVLALNLFPVGRLVINVIPESIRRIRIVMTRMGVSPGASIRYGENQPLRITP